jgi:hypothetical protein
MWLQQGLKYCVFTLSINNQALKQQKIYPVERDILYQMTSKNVFGSVRTLGKVSQVHGSTREVLAVLPELSSTRSI